MNIFKTQGIKRGMPIRLDDWRWRDEAVQETISALSKILGDAYSINCTIDTFRNSTENRLRASDGYIVIFNEIFKVDAHDVKLESNELGDPLGKRNFWIIVETNDSEGSRNLKYGGVTNPYKLRKAVLSSGTVNSGFVKYPYVNPFLPSPTEKIYEMAKSKLVANTTSYAVLNSQLTQGWVSMNGLFVLEKNDLNYVHCQFAFRNDSSTSDTLYTLPIHLRPKRNVIIDHPKGKIVVRTNGEITFPKAVTTEIYTTGGWYTN